ncbi:MAG: hypothetical protein ACM3S4_08425 [Burkholderiales bacterium]
MVCPRCGSTNVTSQAVTETTSKGKVKGFGSIKAFLGWLFFSVPGILCGLCGMGKEKTRTRTRTRVIRICQNCGKQF